MSGQAASYYNEVPQGQPPQPNYGYDQQHGNYQQPNNPPAPYPQPNYPQPNYQQPTYQQPPVEAKPPPQYHQNVPESGYSFDQAFKIEKPKWNDLWAGLLVSFTAIAPSTTFKTDLLHS